MRMMLRSKIHRATVTQANLEYEGSISIDETLMEAAGIVEWEQVHVLDLANGERVQTYAIGAPAGSGEICVNGAAAHLVHPGDRVIILGYEGRHGGPACRASPPHRARRCGQSHRGGPRRGGLRQLRRSRGRQRDEARQRHRHPADARPWRADRDAHRPTTIRWRSSPMKPGSRSCSWADSLGNVVLGYDSTIPVTLEDMVHHGRAVVRGAQRAHVVVDMPFGSLPGGWQDAMRSAVRLMQETGCGSVKLEGGARVAEAVSKLVEAGIPVMGARGADAAVRQRLWRAQGAGQDTAPGRERNRRRKGARRGRCYAIVLETVPTALAHMITRRVGVPTIGIGAGPFCSGQVQVLHDMLGLYEDFKPRHARRFMEGATLMRDAIGAYRESVESGKFPTEKESFYMDERALALIER